MSSSGKIAVLGGGSWGTALALAAARAGNSVSLWARDFAIVEEINLLRRNSRYLPQIELDAPFAATDDIFLALRDADILLLAVPAQTIGEFGEALADLVRPGTVLVCCAKGIDRQSGRLPAEMLGDAVPGSPVAALSGPSFAADVARRLPTAVTIASHDIQLSERLAARLSGANFRCYASDDLIGVELGGALKNVIALAVGAARAMELGASAEAALIARGFAEMVRLARALGARPQTLAGLSGLGDLVLTCSGPQSRNFAYGAALARGAISPDMPLAEGAFTAGVAAALAEEHGVDAPVTEALADVLDGAVTAREAVARLMDRPLKVETE